MCNFIFIMKLPGLIKVYFSVTVENVLRFKIKNKLQWLHYNATILNSVRMRHMHTHKYICVCLSAYRFLFILRENLYISVLLPVEVKCYGRLKFYYFRKLITNNPRGLG